MKKRKNLRRLKKGKERKKISQVSNFYQAQTKCCQPVNSSESRQKNIWKKGPSLEPDPTPIQDPNLS